MSISRCLKKLNFFESAIRTLLKEYIERGKVDIYITYEDFTEIISHCSIIRLSRENILSI